MADWNPDLYRRYEDERTRPARDLLAQVALDAPRRIVDLGCGPGNSTELLVQRFPQAQVTGTDNSEPMLASARERLPGVAFELSDIATWQPAEAPDLIYANAALQWVGGHEALIPRLLAALAPGGVLAIQMPDNREEPSHRLMREVASEAPFSSHIADARAMRTAILPLAGYYDLLAPQAAAIDVWHSIYQHPMASAAAIVEWVRGTGLKPFVERLPAELQPAFLAEYERRIDGAYAPRADGRRLLAFPRLFIVARRKA
ncbi:trans-aconitate 2-methyltransferase [Variovorax terrae]|uniref:Trans-aconitate 2-methyltransferase n=1 Tax=Variovorax terrae TaxID=2923278 RepID=A0A9X1VVX0_9BURK|nr:trans-aconitate 2-methyltransferase [Variovorax terrae]MCJ0764245.1 trans-aconitate 2-methyltransferase [Variovorax terrae]